MTEIQPSMTIPRRPRDARATRALLLAAALRRFTQDGYDTTTVRQIAEDAGVNVALISRYFGSKEGLFEACLELAGEELQAAEATRPRCLGISRTAAPTRTATRGCGWPPTSASGPSPNRVNRRHCSSCSVHPVSPRPSN
jgi:Transcriptional regulator